jgi:hypothetical protein
MNQRSRPGWEPPEPGPGEPWRGSEHAEGWPEEMAGPEYWAYRVRDEMERAIIELVGERTAPDGRLRGPRK